VAGIASSLLQIIPPKGNSFPVQYAEGFDMLRLQVALTKVVTAYYPFPKMGTVAFWNTSAFLKDNSDTLAFTAFVLLGLCSFMFMRKPMVLLLYLISAGMLVGFTYYTLQSGNRYAGHLFLMLMACVWMYHVVPGSNGSLLSQWTRKIFLSSVLFAGTFAGIYAYAMDVKYPFSNCERAGEYLQKEKPAKNLLVGTTDYIMSPLSYYTQRKVYFPERKDSSWFMIWDEKRDDKDLSIPKVFGQAEQIMKSQKLSSLVLALSPELKVMVNGVPTGFTEGDITAGLRMKLSDKFEKDCIEPSEKYYFYVIERK
jgi:hypothetical protein